VIERREIDLATASALVEAVVAAAGAHGHEFSVAVVDRGGALVAAARMDAAALGSLTLAQDKAYTAILWGVPTGEFMASTQPGGVDWGYNTTTGGRVVVYAGGLPLFSGAEMVGGIGVSGATAEQDEACAAAAVAACGLSFAPA
jgi:uncharacterized protein GlcG (DUF336 family)